MICSPRDRGCSASLPEPEHQSGMSQTLFWIVIYFGQRHDGLPDRLSRPVESQLGHQGPRDLHHPGLGVKHPDPVLDTS